MPPWFTRIRIVGRGGTGRDATLAAQSRRDPFEHYYCINSSVGTLYRTMQMIEFSIDMGTVYDRAGALTDTRGEVSAQVEKHPL